MCCKYFFMRTAKEVADYFLCKAEPEVGDFISNLKLQKLVYYAQGFHLAIYDEPLFSDAIVAWEHGPVVESLYRFYKGYGALGIPVPEHFDAQVFSVEQINLLDDVYKVYGQFSAWKLRNMTHSERPWIETGSNERIAHALMADFFKGYIN